MGYDLTSKNEYFRLNGGSYYYLMGLAFNNGWNPKGTVMSDMMAEYLTEHRLPPRFSTIFCFAVLNTPSVTDDKCFHSDHKLIEEEKLAMAKDPEAFFDLSDNLSCELERPIKLVKIKEEPPTLYLTETREEVTIEMVNARPLVTNVVGHTTM